MKKLLSIICISATVATVSAQTEFDALKLSQRDIVGTSRYMSMGGALGALGADASAININPAGLGMYRHSDIGFSFGLTDNYVTTDWYGGSTDESRWRVPFTSASFVCSFTDNKRKSGIISNNIAFTFNKVKNFNRNTSAIAAQNSNASMTDYMAELTNENIMGNGLNLKSGYYGVKNPYSNLSLGYLTIMGLKSGALEPNADTSKVQSCLTSGETVLPEYNIHEEGYVNEWNFSYGMNIANRVFWGIGVGFQDLKYRKDIYYQEKFQNGGSMSLESSSETTGAGINVNLGVLVAPIDEVRIGAAIHTPTFYTSSQEDNGITLNEASRMTSLSSSEYNTSSTYFELTTPWRYNFSTAFLIGHRGAVSLDYEIVDYNTMRLKNPNGLSSFYNVENNGIKELYRATHSLRAGLELQAFEGFFVRAGYAFVTSPFKNPNNASKLLAFNTVETDPSFMINRWTNYFSGGIGYRTGLFYVDLAYQLRQEKYDVYTFDNLSYASTSSLRAAKAKNYMHNIVLTLGMRL